VMPSPTSHTYISQRLRLHYLDWGNPDAPPLVLVHGGRDHARSWDWVVERLRDRWHIIAHDLRGHGDNIATRYAGIYPDKVRRLVSIEGLGLSPKAMAERLAKPLAERMLAWIEAQRGLAARQPRRYESIKDAVARMQAANKRLSLEQANHLTRHGVNQNEDGTYSWKFDPYLHVFPPVDLPAAEVERLWAQVACP